MKNNCNPTGLLFLGALIISSTMAYATVYTYTVPATANISSAGLTVPVAPGGYGAGTLPISLAINPGEVYLTANASGTIAEAFSYNHPPDGSTFSGSANISAYGGISGFRADIVFPLTGVFLTAATPVTPAPATLDFRGSAIGLNFTTLSPQIGQVFFIGDGKTSGGVLQRFNIPVGATRLFLGYPDAPNSTGPVGGFSDNSGSLSVGITVVPEPSVGALLIIGMAFISGRLARR